MTIQEIKELINSVVPLGLGKDRLLGTPPRVIIHELEKVLQLGAKLHYDSKEGEKAKQFVVIGFGTDKIVVYYTRSRKEMLEATSAATKNKLQWYIHRSNKVVYDSPGITEIVY